VLVNFNATSSTASYSICTGAFYQELKELKRETDHLHLELRYVELLVYAPIHLHGMVL
jgi:hypothetical protein